MGSTDKTWKSRPLTSEQHVMEIQLLFPMFNQTKASQHKESHTGSKEGGSCFPNPDLNPNPNPQSYHLVTFTL